MSDTPTLIDTHCHLNFHRYDDDRAEVLRRAADAGVTRVIIPAIDVPTSDEALQLAAKYDATIYAAVGVHPNSTAEFDDTTLQAIKERSHNEHVVAIGEIGLDYHWDKSPKAKQIAAFEQQLALAAERELPVIIHNREASDDVIAVLEQWVSTLPESLKARPGVLHSFSAPQDIADKALEMGFYLGFTGPVTFKNAPGLRSVASTVPLERMVVETDGPFLTPEPHRGQRNEPAYVVHIAERLAALKQVSDEAFAATTTANAERLFALAKK